MLRGASDEQILEPADDAFAKHIERLAQGKGDSYIERSINSARSKAFENGWITSPNGGWPKKSKAAYRHRTPVDYDVAVLLAEGTAAKHDWIAELTPLGWSRATAYRFAEELEDDGRIEFVDGLVRVLVPLPT